MANGLYTAVRECRFKQLQFLVESGLTVNQKNKDDQHTLVAALQIENETKRGRMLKYLIRHKANCRAFDNKTKRDVFLWACFLSRTKEAEMILEYIEEDMDFCKKDAFDRTALHYATMRGNNELLSFLCQKMAKYELSVDIRDAEGFTPFLLAKRLGFDDCADILLKEGLASPYQFDIKSRKMGHDWEEEGTKEHLGNLSVTNKKQVAMYKTLGRLPALKRASFDSTKVNVVASKKDKHFLSVAEKKEDPLSHRDIADFSRQASKNPKRSMSLGDLSNLEADEKEMRLSQSVQDLTIPVAFPVSARSSNSTGSGPNKLHSRTESALTMASTDEALRLINLNTPLPQDDNESNFSSPPDTYRSSIQDSIPEMMTILEEQCSEAFRPKAKPKPKDLTRQPTISPTKSTMAIIFGRDGSKKVVKKEVTHKFNRPNRKLSSIKEAS